MLSTIIETRIKFSLYRLNGQLASEEAKNFLYDNVFMLSHSIAEERETLVGCPFLFQSEPILVRCWEDGQVAWANTQY